MKIDDEIYEYGEVERDAARAADFHAVGGFWYRLLKWIERQCRESREELIAERNRARATQQKDQP